MIILFLILIGIFAGLLAGMLGIGGGVIFAPVLFYMFDARGIENPEVWAIGSSLLCTLATSGSASFKQLRMHNFSPRESFKVGLFGIVGITIGKQYITSDYFNSDVFLIIFFVILVYTGIQFLRKTINRATPPAPGTDRLVTWREAVPIGGGGGLIAALTGIGGGIVMVPIMNMIYRIPFQKAVSISVGAIMIISLSGVIQLSMPVPAMDGLSPYTLGYIDFGTAIALVLGAIAGAYT
ncbi:MAG: sulfite exporter TauE/SafE family protein, partial [Rhodothermaceae bacterium]|nr:sulfite exporter TauE/SafE family protein [Rhodothermaceae bacterium]